VNVNEVRELQDAGGLVLLLGWHHGSGEPIAEVSRRIRARPAAADALMRCSDFAVLDSTPRHMVSRLCVESAWRITR
jgi:hypothetical protein